MLQHTYYELSVLSCQLISVGAQVLTIGMQVLTIGMQNAPAYIYVN